MSVDKKMRVAALSVVSNTVLILLKVVAGVLSGSVSIISEAIHSGMDLVAAIIAFFSVRMSAIPPDKEHPYGHGKIENVSGVVEGLLIFIAAFLIIKEAIKKISEPHDINQVYIAILVMIISGVVNYFVSKKLYMVAKETDSVALEADALHLKTDVYTSIGVGVGLLLMKLSQFLITDPVLAAKFFILDPIVAILVALLIIKEAWHLVYNAFNPLLDARLSEEEEDLIKVVIGKYQDKIIDFHELRTRKAGNIKYIDFHMTVNKELTVAQSHELCEVIENALEEDVKNTNVNIHIEPGVINSVEKRNEIPEENQQETQETQKETHEETQKEA